MSATATHNRSSFKTAMRWGLMLSLVGIAMFTIGTIAGIIGFTTAYYLVLAVLVIILVHGYRKRQPGGNISFGEIFSLVFQTVIYAGIIYAAYTFVFYHYISPASFQRLMDTTITQTRQQLLSRGVPQDQLDAQVNITKNIANNVGMQLGGSILSFAVVGAIVGLIAAPMLKRELTEPAA